MLGISLLALCTLSGCKKASTDNPEAGKPSAEAQDSLQENRSPEIPAASRPIDPEPHDSVKQAPWVNAHSENEAKKINAPEKIDWGPEISLDEIVSMARSGRIREIQWHVMPNILRIEARDGRIFHLKNENKGVDLRNTLIEAGVEVGEGGVVFRHVF